MSSQSMGVQTRSIGTLLSSAGCFWSFACFAASPWQLTPEQRKDAIGERKVVTRARLEAPTEPGGERTYRVLAAMRVGASWKRTREVLKNYRLYPKMISYVHRADFNEKTQTLWLQGGVFKYLLSSWITFKDVSPKQTHFQFVDGHFRGMQGDFEFEDLGERGTFVTIQGWYRAREFPPRFVIENGAQIVFGFTANRMRTYIEREFKNEESQAPNGRAQKESGIPQNPQETPQGQIPQPKRRILPKGGF